MSVVEDAPVDSSCSHSPNDVDTLQSDVHCASLLGHCASTGPAAAQPKAGSMDATVPAVTTTAPAPPQLASSAAIVTTSTVANGGQHQNSSNSNNNNVNSGNGAEANNLPDGVRVLRNVVSNVESISDSIATHEEIKKLKHVQGRSNSTGRLYSSSRRVSFPENDSELVTGYLEPADPWACGMYLFAACRPFNGMLTDAGGCHRF